MDLQLNEKVAIVTGGASGIGESIVRQLANEGATVAIVDRDHERGERIVAQLNDAANSSSHQIVSTDLCDFDACQRAIETVLESQSRIDIVVNNAGTNDAVGLQRGPEAFEASLRLNLTHYFAMVHHAEQQLRANAGAIVNISSKVASTGQGGTSGYAAAKGAVNALTREWAVDFASDNVRVNAVVPAEVWTPMYENWLGSLEDGANEKERIAQRIPLGRRFTKAEELANVAVFLASPAAGHVTGQIVYVDGGYTHFDRRI